jgi:hypothetical protein
MKTTAKALGQLLGITPRHVNRLADEGVLERDGDSFDLEASVRRYCDHLRKDEETKRERRALLRAQTEATRARAQRHGGEQFTRDDVLRTLQGPIADLWSIRSAVSWHRERLQAAERLDTEAIDVECRRLWAETSGLIAAARDKFDAAFPRTAASIATSNSTESPE